MPDPAGWRLSQRSLTTGLGSRVLFCLRGDASRASSRVRGYWIAAELERLGVRCTIQVARTRADHLRSAGLIPRCDVVVFQKRYSRYDTWAARFARRLGRRVFLDLDDAPRPKVAGHAAAMMRLADGVLAGSGSLVRLAGAENPRTYLVPTGIRLENYPPNPARATTGRLCLGWIGNGADYAEDLATILPGPLAILAARHPLRLKLVGACGERRLHETFPRIPGLEVELVDAIAWADPAAVSAAVADFDIGLYPLLDTEFNRFKCGFKALEYMARGVPVVASDIVSNAEIVADGADGLLVAGPQRWVEGLERLIDDAALRARFGAAGRRKVERDFSTRRIAGRMLAIFEGTVPPDL